jgi:AcrR family transcriptional regulator
MTKTVTIEAIEDKAIEIFCREGYDRASLREIASEAGVPLSSIHFYFRSKADLYLQVSRKLFDRLEADRLTLLEGARPDDLEAVVRALIAPLILSKYKRPSAPSSETPLIRTWLETTAYLEGDPQHRNMLRRSVETWIERMMTACPGLSFADSQLAQRLISSALFHWETNATYYNDILTLPGGSDEEDECARLVRLLAAGIRALAS